MRPKSQRIVKFGPNLEFIPKVGPDWMRQLNSGTKLEIIPLPVWKHSGQRVGSAWNGCPKTAPFLALPEGFMHWAQNGTVLN